MVHWYAMVLSAFCGALVCYGVVWFFYSVRICYSVVWLFYGAQTCYGMVWFLHGALICYGVVWYFMMHWYAMVLSDLFVLWCTDILWCCLIFCGALICYCVNLTHLPLTKMASVSQTIYSDAFYRMQIFSFWLQFHWSVFLRVQLTITQHWFR